RQTARGADRVVRPHRDEHAGGAARRLSRVRAGDVREARAAVGVGLPGGPPAPHSTDSRGRPSDGSNRSHYPGGPPWVYVSVLPHGVAAFLPLERSRRPRLPFRGLLGIHSRCGPDVCWTHLVGLLSPGLRQAELLRPASRVATKVYRHFLGWNLHPLVSLRLRGAL